MVGKNSNRMGKNGGSRQSAADALRHYADFSSDKNIKSAACELQTRWKSESRSSEEDHRH